MAEASNSSISVTRRKDQTFLSTFLRHFLRQLRGMILRENHKPQPAGSQQLTCEHKYTNKTSNITERKVANHFLYDMTRKTSPATARYTRRIYYFAGGSWQMPPGKQQWALCARLTDALPDTIVTMISHGLAPNSPAPKALPALIELFGQIMKDASAAGERVVFAGDSSGGNIALTVPIEAARQHPEWPVPVAIMAICPSTDLTRDNPQIKAIDKYDPVLTVPMIEKSAKLWRADWDAKDPRISPLFADLSVIKEKGVKIHGVTAGYDLLGPDGVLFRDRLAEAGIEGEWLEWDKQIHVFPLMWMYGVKTAYDAFDWIKNVIAST